MRLLAGPFPPLGFDACSTATGLSLVTGALSVVEPFLSVLTATLVSIAVAAWVLGRPRGGEGRGPRIRAPTVVGLGALATGGLLYLEPPGPITAFRALLLALLLVPLWHDARARPAPGPARREVP